MKRILIMFAVAATASGAVYGAATTLGGITSQQNIAADVTTITPCDNDGVRLQWGFLAGTNGTLAYQAVVDQVADACAGKNLTVSVYDGTGTEITARAVTVPPASGSNDIDVFVNFLVPPKVKDIASAEVMIADPFSP